MRKHCHTISKTHPFSPLRWHKHCIPALIVLYVCMCVCVFYIPPLQRRRGSKQTTNEHITHFTHTGNKIQSRRPSPAHGYGLGFRAMESMCQGVEMIDGRIGYGLGTRQKLMCHHRESNCMPRKKMCFSSMQSGIGDHGVV